MPTPTQKQSTLHSRALPEPVLAKWQVLERFFTPDVPKKDQREKGEAVEQIPTQLSDFQSLSVFAPAIQPKLRVNAENDVYEQEADQVAETVTAEAPVTADVVPVVQPLEKVDDEREEEEEEKRENQSLPAKVIDLNGQPLPTDILADFQPHFGIDLRHVRIHRDATAQGAAQALEARAFTIGPDLVFAPNQFQPRTQEGRKLIAHELAHVAQQGRPGFTHTGMVAIQRKKGGTWSGFWDNLWRALSGKSTFTDQEINDYLKDYIDKGDIEDDYNSDDKARAVVRRWKLGRLRLNRQRKVLLIREMFSGATFNQDENAILDILKGSPGELTYLLTKIKPNEFRDEFDGEEKDELEEIIVSWQKRTGSVRPTATDPKKAEYKTITDILGDGPVEKALKFMVKAVTGVEMKPNKGMKVTAFEQYIVEQADWFTEPTLVANEPARNQLWEVAFLLGEGDHISGALGELYVSDFLNMTADQRDGLLHYAEGVKEGVKTVRIKKPHSDYDKIVKLGKVMKELKTFVPGQVLKVVIEQTTLEKLEQYSLVQEFKDYYQQFKPTLEHPDEGPYLIMLLREGIATYNDLKGWVRDLHAITKKTRSALVANVVLKDRKKPVLLILFSGLDHNTAFLPWPSLEKVVNDTRNLALVLQGEESLKIIRKKVIRIADEYGQRPSPGDKPILGQVIFAGHGAAVSIELATTNKLTKGQDDTNVTYEREDLNPRLAGDPSYRLINTVLSRLDPKDARVVFAGCLVGSHDIPLTTQLSDKKTAAANINKAIKNNPNLRDLVYERMEKMGLKKTGTVEAANASTFASALSLDSNGKAELNLTSDPDIGGSKAQYVLTGAEPVGALRAVLETYADSSLGPTWTTNEMKKHIALFKASGKTYWRNTITNTAFELVLNASGAEVDPTVVVQYLRKVGTWKHQGWEKDSDASALAKSVTKKEAAVLYPAMLSSKGSSRYFKIVLYQAWMQIDAKKRTDFMAAVGAASNISGSRLDKLLKMKLVKPHLGKLLHTSTPTSPDLKQVKLAITIAQFHRNNMPQEVKDFLKNIVGNKTSTAFPPALTVGDFLEGASELSILRALGLAPGISVAPARKPAKGKSPPPSNLPEANADLKKNDDINESLISVKPQKVILPTDVPVWEEPSPTAKILATLKKGDTIRIAGSYQGWAAIDFQGKVAYVDLTLTTV